MELRHQEAHTGLPVYIF